MSVQRVASRYAKSLLDLAKEQGRIDAVTDDMRSFKTLLANRDLYLLLKSPVISTDKKKQIFKVLFEGKFNELTLAFLNILATKARESYMPEIVGEYLAQYKKLNNIATVRVTTAAPMSSAALKAIEDKLQNSGIAKGAVEISAEVDQDLIGGFVLEVEDKIYDASIQSKLEGLKRQFKGNLYISKVSQ